MRRRSFVWLWRCSIVIGMSLFLRTAAFDSRRSIGRRVSVSVGRRMISFCPAHHKAVSRKNSDVARCNNCWNAKFKLLRDVNRPELARSFASTKLSLSTSAGMPLDSLGSDEEEMLDPAQFSNGVIPYLKAMSPSSIMEFKACPQSFLFRYLYGIKQPTNLALAKGSMCHSALEKLFDLKPEDRSLEALQNLLRLSWSENRLSDNYRFLFEKKSDHGTELTEEEVERDIQAERDWGQSALNLLKNYYEVENPQLVESPNPLEREVWVRANLPVDPSNPVDTFLVRGIVDRICLVQTPDGPVLRITDYKTGKAPNFKYSPPVNERIADENFFQLKIYALLLQQMRAAGKAPPNLFSTDLRMLRLFYLTSASGAGQYLDMDMGATPQERNEILRQIHMELSDIWTSIRQLVETQDPKSFVHCDRSFCSCHETRARFAPGTVWERERPK
uniref:PD-(D/E)XK endonuclease-like domain-containing protein n=1 Tax=Attheya septentrionalis TaxID=420275 RepID=A0A7S2UQ23_9STRA|mmetsp:Transcript_7669/g.13827  ORF Transcript_7669/g.13827 Transcript_7669/m.13827 type:complete len:446 (+) Transcript_7669:166-1503(+)